MEQLRLRDHLAFVSQNEVHLRDLKGGQVNLLPAEISEVRELIGILWKMTSLPAMPNSVQSPSGTFTAEISGKKVEIRRTDEAVGNSGFAFPISECDFVIDLIDLSLNKLKDLFALSPQPRASGAVGISGDFDVIEGRS